MPDLDPAITSSDVNRIAKSLESIATSLEHFTKGHTRQGMPVNDDLLSVLDAIAKAIERSTPERA